MASRYRVEAVHSFVSYNDVFHCEKSEIAGCYWSWSFLQRVPLQRFEGPLSLRAVFFFQPDMFSKGALPFGIACCLLPPFGVAYHVRIAKTMPSS